MTYKEQLKDVRWTLKRIEILERDYYKCQYCKGTKDLRVHHLIYISGLKAWEYDNELLITLCESHHNLIHELHKIFVLIAKNFLLKKIDYIKLNELIEKL